MPNVRRVNPVYRSMSRPLTILGAATFNLLGSLLGGMLIFLLLYLLARWATETDPRILRLLLASAKVRTQYDPASFSPVAIRRLPQCLD
jgi:hypothetical protein